MPESTPRRELAGWRRVAVDFGPLLVFFAVWSWKDMFAATAAFMAATAIAIGFSFLSARHVPAMTWFSALLVGVFGGLTLLLQDEIFIKMKPTFVYMVFAAVIFFGILRRRNYLRMIMGAALTGLDERGWHILAIRWAWFFIILAALNEIFWRYFSTEIWMHFKLWGDTALTFLFAVAQLPMLKRHGLRLEEDTKPQ
ncbi:MAG: septation protein A [Sphingomonadaceae bacterium]